MTKKCQNQKITLQNYLYKLNDAISLDNGKGIYTETLLSEISTDISLRDDCEELSLN